jgi:hypothetical protein
MKSAERREQLLRIMNELFLTARVQADFTASVIAEKANVSMVLVYRLIGTEFKELRGRLAGPRRSPSTLDAALRREIAGLRKQLGILKAQHETDIREAVAGAIRVIEEVEEENRRLQNRCEQLERRLNENELVVIHVPAEDKGTGVSRRNKSSS